MIALQCVVPPITHFTPEIRLSPTTLPAHSQAGLLGVRSLGKCKPQCALCTVFSAPPPLPASCCPARTVPYTATTQQETPGTKPQQLLERSFVFYVPKKNDTQNWIFKKFLASVYLWYYAQVLFEKCFDGWGKTKKYGNIDITYTVSFQKELKAELSQKVCWDSL